MSISKAVQHYHVFTHPKGKFQVFAFFLLKERRHWGIFKCYRHTVAESPFFSLLSLLLRYIKQQWKDTLIGLKLKLLIFILIYCCQKPDPFIRVCNAAMGIWEVLKSFCNTKSKHCLSAISISIKICQQWNVFLQGEKGCHIPGQEMLGAIPLAHSTLLAI